MSKLYTYTKYILQYLLCICCAIGVYQFSFQAKPPKSTSSVETSEVFETNYKDQIDEEVANDEISRHGRREFEIHHISKVFSSFWFELNLSILPTVSSKIRYGEENDVPILLSFYRFLHRYQLF